MSRGSILLLTGSPGAAKATVARLVAERFDPSVCLESGWFWTTILGGHLLPWLPAADSQNAVLRACAAAAAAELAGGGYTVVVDEPHVSPGIPDSRLTPRRRSRC